MLFFLSFSTTFLVTLILMYTFQISPYSFKLKKILKSNEYELLDGVKIYNPVNNKKNAEITDEIVRLDDELAILLGSIQKTDLTILVFEELEEMRKLTGSRIGVAFYDEKLHVIALAKPEDESKLFLTEELRHEYVHFYLNDYLNENRITDIPVWFAEGLAEYVAITVNGGKATRPIEEVVNFRLLNGNIAWNIYSRNFSHTYIQSHHALEYIVRDNNQDIIKKIIDDSAELNFSKSFYKHTGIEVKELHQLIH